MDDAAERRRKHRTMRRIVFATQAGSDARVRQMAPFRTARTPRLAIGSRPLAEGGLAEVDPPDANVIEGDVNTPLWRPKSIACDDVFAPEAGGVFERHLRAAEIRVVFADRGVDEREALR